VPDDSGLELGHQLGQVEASTGLQRRQGVDVELGHQLGQVGASTGLQQRSSAGKVGNLRDEDFP
jgi:hypothetical protein